MRALCRGVSPGEGPALGPGLVGDPLSCPAQEVRHQVLQKPGPVRPLHCAVLPTRAAG